MIIKKVYACFKTLSRNLLGYADILYSVLYNYARGSEAREGSSSVVKIHDKACTQYCTRWSGAKLRGMGITLIPLHFTLFYSAISGGPFFEKQFHLTVS
jgi:hypothetical protein